MPVPDTSGVPPFADFEMVKSKINEIVQKYNNLLVNMDSLNVVSLTADHIDSGTINAGVVTVRADYASGAYIEIGPDGMTIFDGSNNTFTADISGHVTMTGATVQSTTGFPKVIMDPNGNLFAAYQDANNSIRVVTNSGTGAPGLQFYRSGTLQSTVYIGSGGLQVDSSSGGYFFVNTELRVPNVKNITDGVNTTGSTFAANMTYDATTKNLKLWSASGALLAQVNISGS